MKVAVGTQNPVKLAAVREAFATFFEDRAEVIDVDGFAAVSGVRPQPIGQVETIKGAKTRTLQLPKGYDYYVGIEGGVMAVESLEGVWYETRAAVFVMGHGKHAYSHSAALPLPRDLAALIVHERLELRDAAKQLYGDAVDQQGVFGMFTRGAVGRTSAYRDAILFALGVVEHNAA